jgi:OOP family OmpA-OmpF porin
MAAGQAGAMSLEFPGLAAPVAEKLAAAGSYFLPTAPFADAPLTGINAEGSVHQQSWKISGGTLTTMQILAPLRDQLEKAGFEELYTCEAKTCGGFDFRYGIELLPEPDMHVNLGDYRYFAARRVVDEQPEYIGLMVSRSANAGFVQMTSVGEAPEAANVIASSKQPPARTPLAEAGPIGAQLELAGHATLDDLSFATGSSELEEQEFASLEGLASYLAARPDRTVVLVGHTDAQGALDGNVALSRRRAGAVMDRLVQTHGVSPDQVSANGVGFLAPRASNLTEEGRTQNRRVEVILTSTQ